MTIGNEKPCANEEEERFLLFLPHAIEKPPQWIIDGVYAKTRSLVDDILEAADKEHLTTRELANSVAISAYLRGAFDTRSAFKEFIQEKRRPVQ